ncbi:virulence RhuM family protein [Candidatus Magnetominusculus dajiuhuensis]|uniref:virulence RhuM family protein n=1 Tax=Candidatus Magnetominusculus dajiuhuensis TaxID=3137712 RepID=UPI003B43936B
MKDKNLPVVSSNSFLLYVTEGGKVRIEVKMQDETVWLTQEQMAQLFDKSKSTINEHIKNIYAENELSEEQTMRKFGISELSTKPTNYYNLDMIISVGYRVNSLRGTQFRIWATQRLREYIIKGFTMDDERLKQAGGGNYFDELLARIRDIRSSEKIFYRKVMDIYATSIDYSPNTELSKEFFKVIQNKMHWAAHGHTAAEVIENRANAALPNMGLTSWHGDRPRKDDVVIAKNYLNEKELNLLNRIVTAYLEFAEIQAIDQKPMYMKDWIAKLDDFLKLSGRALLTHAGKISRDDAAAKAITEYEKFRQAHLNEPSPVERHFNDAIREVKHIEKTAKKGRKKGRKED